MKLTWQHVAVVGLIIIGVVVLVALGRDPTALIGLGVAILLGAGLIQQGEIKSATNGNMSRLVGLMEAMAAQLRHMPPPDPATPPSDDGQSQ